MYEIKKKLFKLKIKLKLLAIAAIILLLMAIVNMITSHSPLGLFQNSEDSDRDDITTTYTYEEVQSKLGEYYSAFDSEIHAYDGVHTNITYTNTKSNAIDCMLVYAFLASDWESDDDNESDPSILTKNHLKVLKDVFNEMNTYEVTTEEVIVSGDGDKIGDFTVIKHDCYGTDGVREYPEATYGYALVSEDYVDQIPLGSIIKIGDKTFRIVGTQVSSFAISVCEDHVEEEEEPAEEKKEETKKPSSSYPSGLRPEDCVGKPGTMMGTGGRKPSTTVKSDGSVSKPGPTVGAGIGGVLDDTPPRYTYDGTSQEVFFVASSNVPNVSYIQTNVSVKNMTEQEYWKAHPMNEDQQDFYEMLKDDEDTYGILKSLGYSESGGTCSLDALITLSTPVTGDNAAFIETMGAYAVTYYPSTGILPSIMVAQACLESGFGTSKKAVQEFNFYGMHYTSKRFGADCPFYENSGGKWPIFSSMPQGVAAYYSFMESPYYDALHWNDDPSSCAYILNEHYCPDEGYTSRILSLIYSNNLTRFDDMCK